KGSAQLKVYLTICRDILTDDAEQFLFSVLKAVNYLSEIKDEETRRMYLQVLIRYIFQTRKNVTKSQAREIANIIPEGSEIVMTLAEIYRNEGKEEGKKERGIEIAKKLI